MAYIYKIKNDINDKIYIGKTEFSIEKRFVQHCRDALRERNEKRPLYSAMKKYGVEHFFIELVEETNEPEEREAYWIKYYNSFEKGYNATLGGDGKKYIDYDLVIQTYKKELNAATTANILNISPDSVRKILKENNVEIISSQEISAKKNSKKVEMFDLNDNYIRTFNSMIEAGKYLIDNKKSNCKLTTIRQHISEVVRGKRKTCAGFKWKLES